MRKDSSIVKNFGDNSSNYNVSNTETNQLLLVRCKSNS